MPDRDKPIERAMEHEEAPKASLLIPLDDDEALLALARFERASPTPRSHRPGS